MRVDAFLQELSACLDSLRHRSLRDFKPMSPGNPPPCMRLLNVVRRRQSSSFLQNTNQIDERENMENGVVTKPNPGPWASRLFTAAGVFMLINTAFLWIRFLSDPQMSILWQALSGVIGLACGVLGLFMLYPRAYASAPLLARGGAGFALLAGASLSLGAIWIVVVSMFQGGVPEPAPEGVIVLIGIFIVAMVLAFLSNAIAFLIRSDQRRTGYLLSLPLAMWALMLVIGLTRGMTVGLSLDFYTNAVIAAAFFGLGMTLKEPAVTER